MSSIMRARSAVTGRGEGWDIGVPLFELKVAGPSMLGIGCPDRHPLPLIHSPLPSKMHRPRRRPPARAGSFKGGFLPFRICPAREVPSPENGYLSPEPTRPETGPISALPAG